VRRALNYAVDKEGIVNNILAGTTRIASQGMTPQVPGYDADVKPYPYDPAKARAMLAEAGYANGFPMRIAVYGGLLAGDQSVFQKVAQDLNSVGVRAELQTMTFSDYVRRLFNGDWKGIDAFSNGWLNVMLGDVGRAMDQYSCAFEAAFFCDESVMPLIAAARTEMDPDKRAELLRTAMAKMNDVGVALWLVEFSFIVAHDPKYTFGRFRRDGSLFEHITQVQK
jgi:peptide/nickel transport system substrate-binding protein